MNFRTMMRSRTTAGALFALALVAGLVLSPSMAFGAASISLNQPANVTTYTQGGVLPSELITGVAATTDLETNAVTFNVVGGALTTDGTQTSTTTWAGDVNLLDDPAIGATPPIAFTSTISAMATSVYTYAGSPVTTTDTDMKSLMVTVSDVSLIDGDENGVPNASALSAAAASPNTVTRLEVAGPSGETLVTKFTSVASSPTVTSFITSAIYYGGGTEFPGTNLAITVTSPSFATLQAVLTGTNIGSATDAVLLVSTSIASGDLTQNAGDNPADDIPELLGAFVRVQILHNGGTGGAWESISALPSSNPATISVTESGISITAVGQYVRPLVLTTNGQDLDFNDVGLAWIGPDQSATAALPTSSVTFDSGRLVTATASGFTSTVESLGLIGWDIDGTATGGGGGGGGTCFIATAAYGTPMAEEINTLRAVRDTYMLNNIVGTAFVDTYYRLSPSIADKVAESPLLAAVVRALLTPFILVGKLILTAPMALMALMLAGAGLVLAHRRTRSNQS